MAALDFLPKRYFSMAVLPYWCIVVLDCVTIIASGMMGVYVAFGGVPIVNDFWDYIYIWIFALPLFILPMVLFRTYGGVITKRLAKNLVGVACSLVVGGVLLEGFSLILPDVIFPFRPPLRGVIISIVISFVLQSLYRILAAQMVKVDRSILTWKPLEEHFKGIHQDLDLAVRKKINLCLAHMSEDKVEQKYVQEAFDTNWIVPLGPNVNAFEVQLETYVSQDNDGKQIAERKVAALSAGTAALHLALIACGVRPGDEVCVQSFTFCASVNPIVYLGATPVFIDSEPKTWNMDPALLEKAIEDRIKLSGRKPKAIIPVALYGMPYDVEGVMRVANKYGIPVIEDAAEGLGSRYKGQTLGTFGQYGVLSFNGNKMITTSGGGALICRDEASKKNILWFATQAREAYPYYQHEAIGYNYRMSNVCAGIGRGQMTVLDDHIEHHKHIQQLYVALLSDIRGIEVHQSPGADYDSNCWLCTILLAPDLKVRGQEQAYAAATDKAVGGAAGVIHQAQTRTTDCQPNDNVEALRLYLDAAQIESRPLWKPMHKQPVYQHAPAYLNGVSEQTFKVGLCLPSGPCVSDEDVQYIVSKIREAIS